LKSLLLNTLSKTHQGDPIMPKGWKKFAHSGAAYQYTAASLKKAWPRLHAGDAEPLPKDAESLEAWIAYHAGDFAQAVDLGLAAGTASGLNAANKAQCIYANYLESNDKKKLELFSEVAQRCEQAQADDKKNANAFYLYAYAMGRYGQGIGVVKAATSGIAGKVKTALDAAIKLAPKHADAHIALGTYHAEIIDKLGALVGSMTYGASKDTGLKMFKKALELNPNTAIGKIEYANGMVILEGKKAIDKAEALYAEAAEHEAVDAMERLDVELAKSEMEE
jgi:tetratricopeptide (TPR) repeat protein